MILGVRAQGKFRRRLRAGRCCGSGGCGRKGKGRPLTRGACGSASVRAGEAGERGTAGEVGAGVRTAGPERVQREAGRTGPSAGLLRVGVEMGRTCGIGPGMSGPGGEEVGWAAQWFDRAGVLGLGWILGLGFGPEERAGRAGLLAGFWARLVWVLGWFGFLLILLLFYF